MMVVVSSVRMHCPYIIVYVFSARKIFCLIEWLFNPIRELLVTAMIYMSLMHNYGYHAMLVIIVIHAHHTWEGLLVSSIL